MPDTVIKMLNKAIQREGDVILPALIFWFFCIKTKEQQQAAQQ
jgi:hypothetical protein